MPTTKSAKKALKQSETRRSRNRHFSEIYKESVKKLERAVASKSGDFGALLSEVYSRVDTLVKKNIIHPNNAARKKSAFAKLAKSAPGGDAAPKAVKAPKAAAKKAPAAKAVEAAPKKAPAKKAAAPKAVAEKKAPVAKKPAAKKPAAKKKVSA
jgi:ribosomal protein S20